MRPNPMLGGWFFVLGGLILMLSGVLQAVVRPRKPGENRYLNRGTVWAVVCVVAGLGAVLIGSGVVPIRPH
jgi:hypothetical protein